MRKESGVWTFLALQIVFVNAFRRVVRSGVCQGLDLEEGWERVVETSIVAVREETADGIHWLRWLEERAGGGGEKSQLWSLCV